MSVLLRLGLKNGKKIFSEMFRILKEIFGCFWILYIIFKIIIILLFDVCDL